MIMLDIKPITIVPITITLTSLITLLLVLVISYYYIILRSALLRSQQLHYKRFTITTTTRLLLRCRMTAVVIREIIKKWERDFLKTQ